jgi:hypothetical protein
MKILKLLFLIAVIYTSAYSQPQPVWTSTFNGSNNNNDKAFKTVLDVSGNIYVLGTSYNSQTKEDIFLSKYNNAGNLLWQKFYTGDVDNDDLPAGIGTDAQSNVYILINNYSASTLKRIVLRKYSAAGALLWSTAVSHPVSFVTNAQRTGQCLKVIPDGTVFAGGKWFSTQGQNTVYGLMAYKFNASGSIIDSTVSINGVDTVSTISIIDINTDNSGNVYLAGTNANNMYIKKLDINFDSVWTKTYNGNGNGFDAGTKVVIDNNYFSYLAGYVKSGANGNDYCVLKYDNGGAQQWVRTYDGPAHGDDIPADFVVAPDGNIFITGKASGGSSGYDIATCKITPMGNILWSNLYNGSSNSNDFGSVIALDNSGALYVGGTSNEGADGTDYTIIKYSSLFANQNWASNYSLSTSDTLTSMILDNNFNIFVCGHHKRFLNNDRDMAIFKLGSTIGIQPINNEIPDRYELSQNYPNPFNPKTNIKLQIAKAGFVKLTVFDITGKETAILVNENLNAGEYNVDFNASWLTSGVYFYRLETEGFTDVKKMILVK